uniref:DUF7041 domain-containing protein n=1 Tax=Octopus bimaculoides TaxID=37653 RepID=A0A0L8GJL3_OCTBM
MVDMTFQAAIILRIPPFWTHVPALWFHHIEAQFSSNRIASNVSPLTHVIGSLSPENTNVVRDLIMLLTSEELGDNTPSQLLCRMKQLLGDEILPDKIFKQLFLQRLPSNTQVVLAYTRKSTSIEELSELADKIAKVPHRYSMVSMVTPAIPPTNPFLPVTSSSEILDLCSLMTQQAAQIQALSFGTPCRNNSQSRHFGRLSRSLSANHNSHETCCYN